MILRTLLCTGAFAALASLSSAAATIDDADSPIVALGSTHEIIAARGPGDVDVAGGEDSSLTIDFVPEPTTSLFGGLALLFLFRRIRR